MAESKRKQDSGLTLAEEQQARKDRLTLILMAIGAVGFIVLMALISMFISQ